MPALRAVFWDKCRWTGHTLSAYADLPHLEILEFSAGRDDSLEGLVNVPALRELYIRGSGSNGLLGSKGNYYARADGLSGLGEWPAIETAVLYQAKDESEIWQLFDRPGIERMTEFTYDSLTMDISQSPVEKMTGLERLSLRGISEEIDAAVFSFLENLEYLLLDGVYINKYHSQDDKPVLMNFEKMQCEKLEDLELRYLTLDKAGKIDAARLPALKEVSIPYCDAPNIDFLAGNTGVETLYLRGNNSNSIEAVTTLTGLKKLTVHEDDIKELPDLSGMRHEVSVTLNPKE